MIVSVTVTDNRETQIADAIKSVVDHVDWVILLDTGITDRTVQVAEEVAGNKLTVVRHAWVDFSTARNAGLEAARSLGAEWIIIVDSDERLDFGTRSLKDTLANTRTNVLQMESFDGHYPKDKILRASSPMHFTGPTHETLLASGPKENLVDASFFELSKSDDQLKQKFTRDLKLLLDYVKEHPDDPRWWYYLGASYEGLGDRKLAAEAFGECVERRHLIGEEAAWSAYKQAEQLFILDQFNECVAAATRGMGADSTFGECAWLAAAASYRLGRIDQSIAWARTAEAVGLYKGCGHHRAWFRYLPALYELPYDVLRYALSDETARQQAEIDFTAAKCARIGASTEDGLDCLSIMRGAHGRHEARLMLRPPSLEKLCPSTRSTRISFEPPNGYRPMNPSICRHNGELWCVVRTVNYSMSGRSYSIDDPDGVVRTENYLGRLLENGELVEPELMRDLDTSPRAPSRIVGYEDVRLVSLGDELAASATVCDHDPNRRMIGRLYLNDEGDVEYVDVQETNQEHEKNWMPISVGGALTWIYSLDPTAILPGPLRECPFALEHLRGGAAVGFEEGYLAVTHETIEADEGRIYLHRFVRLNDEFNVIAVSPSWVFAKHGIEFCAGLVRDGDDLILSYGVEDREAWIARVNVKEIENMKWITPAPIDEIIDRELLQIPGWCTIEKAKRMAELTRGAKLCVELGVFGGRSLVAMSLALQEQGFGRVDGIDPYTPAASLEGSNDPANNEWWLKLDHEAIAREAQTALYRLKLVTCTRLIRMHSLDVVGFYENEIIDVIHQDSNHSEEISSEEVSLWAPKIRSGGLWIFDDSHWPTTQKAQRALESIGFEEIEVHTETGGQTQWKVYKKK